MILAVLVFLWGLIIGSLLNVIALRLPEIVSQHNDTGNFAAVIKGLSVPASHCPMCKTKLRWFELIPVASYLLQRGKCNTCNESISIQYPLVEAICGFLALWCYMHYPLFEAFFLFIFLSGLLLLAVIDFNTQTLPDEITLPLLWLGLLVNLNSSFCTLEASVLGAVAGYLSLWLVYQVHLNLSGRQGLGFGDFKLFAAIGAWLGWNQLPLILLLGALGGILYFGVLMLLKKINTSTPIAFGPFLALGAFLSLILPLVKFLSGVLL